MASREDLDLRHKDSKKHFGDAEDVAYQLGATHAFDRLAVRAEELDITAELEAATTDGYHSYSPGERIILAGEGAEQFRWHSLGSFAMVKLLGHSEAARQIGTVVDDLIALAVERDRAYQVQLVDDQRAEAAERDARYQAACSWDQTDIDEMTED